MFVPGVTPRESSSWCKTSQDSSRPSGGRSGQLRRRSARPWFALAVVQVQWRAGPCTVTLPMTYSGERAGMAWFRRRRDPDSPPSTSPPELLRPPVAQLPRFASPPSAPVRHPPPSATGLVPFDLWGQRGWPTTEVSGESFYSDSFRALVGRRLRTEGEEIHLDVELVRDPANPYDRNAIAVLARGHHVGHIPAEVAANYAQRFDDLAARGLVPRVAARIWVAERGDWEATADGGSRMTAPRVIARVSIELPDLHMLVPRNKPPSVPHRELPPGRTVQISGEDSFMDALRPYLCVEGECWVYAALEEAAGTSTRSKPVAAVLIDGQRVGQLTPKMSEEFLPAIRYLAERDHLAVARAIVKGNHLKTDVVLFAARSSELPAGWFD